MTERLLPGIDRIAVLRANAIGDYLFTIPALESLKAAYPDAELVLIGAPWHERYLTGRPGPVDRVIVVPPLPGVRAAEPGEVGASLDAFLDVVRAEHFDLAVQVHGGGRYTNPLVATFGARLTAGLRAADAMPLDRWVRYVYHQPEVFRALEVAGLVGATPRTDQPRVVPSAEDIAEAHRVTGAARRLRVALHPGAADPRRRWPAERFAEVGDAAATLGAEIFVTGTPAEAGLVDAVLAAMTRPAQPVVGAVSIGGLAALYAQCAVVVANDTGPLHLARAVDTATIGLFWVGNLVNAGGTGRRKHRPLPSWTLRCPECGADCTRDPYPARTGGTACRHASSFVADIPVEEVLGELHDLLA